EAVLAMLDDGIKDEAPEVRLAAVRGLRSAYPNHSSPQIRDLVRDEPDIAVRKEAVAFLVDHPDPEALKVLTELAESATADVAIRAIALDAIGTLKEMSVLPRLLALAENPSTPSGVVAKTLAVFGRWKSTSARPVFESRLVDPDPVIRAAALEPFAAIADADG